MTDKPSRADASQVDYEGSGKRLAERCIARAKTDQARTYRDRQDWKNLLYYRGGAANHWTAWDGNRYVTKPTTGEGSVPDWVPRCATNIFATQIDGIAALLDQSAPAQEWRPGTDDDEDIAAADVIKDVMPVLRDESGYDDIRPLIHKHIALCDKVAVIVFFDDDPKHGEQQIQALRCVQCGDIMEPAVVEEAEGQCPTCQGDTEPAVDAQFNPIGSMYPTGKIRAELVPSFEFSLPPGSRTLDVDKLPWLLIHTRFAAEEAAGMWGRKARDLRPSKAGSSDASRAYADGLASLSSPQSGSESGMGGASANTTLVYRLYHDPIEDEEFSFPDGLFVAMAEDGTLLEAGPLPLKDDQGRPIKNLALRTFMPIPGTAFGKPPADDLGQLQMQLNLSETLAFMILMHDAAPQTWLPDTITVLGEIANVPGAINRYRTHTPGDRPVTVPGQGFPESLKWWLERIDQKMQELSKLNSVLMGQRPSGDPTLGEVELLREQGLGSFKTPLDQLVSFENKVSMLLLHTARQSMWAPRFRKARGENGQWEISQFTAADISGSIDVHVEPSSAWPKSLLVQQMRVEKAVQMGLLQPAGDPELQVKLLSQMNLSELKPSLDIDRKQIARELDRWKAATMPGEIPAPEIPTINLQMHAFYKAQFLRTELAEAMKTENPAVYDAMLQHVMMLKQAMEPPAPPVAPGEVPPPGAGGKALDEAIQTGALQPAGVANAGKVPGQALDQAIQSGALQPAGVAGAAGSPLEQILADGALVPAGVGQAQQAPLPQAQVPQPPQPGGMSMDELMASGALTPTLGQPPTPGGRVR